MTMTDTDREKLIEGVKDKYEERIKTLMRKISANMREAGMIADEEPFEMHDDEFRWYLTVWRSEDDRKPYREYGKNEFGVDPKTQVPDYGKSVDITFEINESASYGDDPEDGINFGVNIVENGGRILGGLVPFNYTPQCWVPASDEDAVEERFKCIEGADIDNIPDLVRG